MNSLSWLANSSKSWFYLRDDWKLIKKIKIQGRKIMNMIINVIIISEIFFLSGNNMDKHLLFFYKVLKYRNKIIPIQKLLMNQLKNTFPIYWPNNWSATELQLAININE